MKKNILFVYCALFLFSYNLFAQEQSTSIDLQSKAIQSQLVQWRRHIHQYPELGNREFKQPHTLLSS